MGKQRVFYAKTNFEIASTPFSLSCIKKFKELAKQADIIHYHYPFPFMDILHFLCRIKKPTVVSYHSDIVKQKFISRLYSPLMNRFLSSVDCIVAASPNYAKTSTVLQKFESKVKVIPYGLDEILILMSVMTESIIGVRNSEINSFYLLARFATIKGYIPY
ncbi:glycosyltransferase [Citrobacter youngae]|uniref:glycosyltransferase n=1 Tax=Citrobacter youngae TaxID=133448 RepID=UPI00278C23E2|nr:glycosyltransferase [Citrobacter youngae]